MPFVTLTILENILGADINAFEAANVGAIAATFIPAADAMISRLTGIATPSTSTGTDVQLQVYHAWILHYLLIDRQGITDADEIKNRREKYDRAINELETYKAPTAALALPGVQYTTNVGVKAKV